MSYEQKLTDAIADIQDKTEGNPEHEEFKKMTMEVGEYLNRLVKSTGGDVEEMHRYHLAFQFVEKLEHFISYKGEISAHLKKLLEFYYHVEEWEGE